MTGPGGDQPRGYWDVVEVDPPRRLVFVDGFAQRRRDPERRLPRERGLGDDRADLQPAARGCRSRAAPRTSRPWSGVAMGMEEGLTQAVGQIDAILAEGAPARPR